MRFPDYVPAQARAYLQVLIEGAPTRLGMRDCLTSLRRRRNRVRTRLPGSHAIIQDLETRIRELERHIERIEALIVDPRMEDAYLILATEKDGAFDIGGFIHTASACVDDYTKHLLRLQEAKDIAAEVKKCADALATALSRAAALTSPSLPEEFNSTEALLERARLDKRDGCYRPPAVTVPAYVDRGGTPPVLNPQDQQLVERLVEGWHENGGMPWGQEHRSAKPTGFDPNQTRDVVLALAAAADEYKPALGGAAYAALASRKKGQGNYSKQQFLRAFLWSLGGIDYTPGIFKAIALVATVVLDDPDCVVAVADVKREHRKNIKRPQVAHERKRSFYIVN